MISRFATFYDVIGPAATLALFDAGLDGQAVLSEQMTPTCWRYVIEPGAGAAIDTEIFHNAAEALDLAVRWMGTIKASVKAEVVDEQ
jgi:hypothetical protein